MSISRDGMKASEPHTGAIRANDAVECSSYASGGLPTFAIGLKKASNFRLFFVDSSVRGLLASGFESSSGGGGTGR